MKTETTVSAPWRDDQPAERTKRGVNPGRKSKPSTPVSATAQLIGYARISTPEQSNSRQVTELTEAGADRVFTDVGSGRKMERAGLTAALEFARAGDTLAVVEMSRLGRNTAGVLTLIDELHARGVSLRILGLGLDTATVTGKLVCEILAAVSSMEASLLSERTKSGLREAARHKKLGRPNALSERQRELARQLIGEGRSFRQTAEVLGVSARTIQRCVRPSA